MVGAAVAERLELQQLLAAAVVVVPILTPKRVLAPMRQAVRLWLLEHRAALALSEARLV
jgi:hypothetical protein